MRVLFNARDQPWSREVDCANCSSKLEVVAADLSFVADQRDGDAYKLTCPVCEHENWLDASLVPKGLVPR
jgi:hypothetical protein